MEYTNVSVAPRTGYFPIWPLGKATMVGQWMWLVKCGSVLVLLWKHPEETIIGGRSVLNDLLSLYMYIVVVYMILPW